MPRALSCDPAEDDGSRLEPIGERPRERRARPDSLGIVASLEGEGRAIGDRLGDRPRPARPVDEPEDGAALPLGRGIVLDPFMGSGSTVAAAEAVGVTAVGVERFADYYAMALNGIPKLAALELTERTMLEDSAPPDQEELFSVG